MSIISMSSQHFTFASNSQNILYEYRTSDINILRKMFVASYSSEEAGIMRDVMNAFIPGFSEEELCHMFLHVATH